MKNLLFLIILTVLALFFLNAKESTVPKINAPENVSIVYTNNTVTIAWDSVPDTDKYYIYQQSDPYGMFLLVDSTNTTEWLGNYSDSHKFFQVSAKENASVIPEDFVFVQGGTFNMGDRFNEGSSSEIPVHSVNLSDFNIGKYEVTQKEWTDIMGSNPAIGFGVGDDYPVYNVTWYQIIKYCNLRSIGEGLTPCYTVSSSTDPTDWGIVPTSSDSTWNAATCNWSANGYRLPTEAEWEYASRGGTYWPNNYIYSGSNTIGTVAWYWDNSGNTSHIVGTKLSNQLGIYDMSGNVWEWCWDWYGSTYYTICNNLGTVTNPYGPDTGTHRGLRSGGSYGDPIYCRVAYRDGYYPYSYSQISGLLTGFRVVRTQ